MRETFNQNAQRTLMVEGIFDSISTGILIYVVLVELLSPLMTQSKWLRAQRWWLQMLSFGSLYAGAAVMVGAWPAGGRSKVGGVGGAALHLCDLPGLAPAAMLPSLLLPNASAASKPARLRAPRAVPEPACAARLMYSARCCRQ